MHEEGGVRREVHEGVEEARAAAREAMARVRAMKGRGALGGRWGAIEPCN